MNRYDVWRNLFRNNTTREIQAAYDNYIASRGGGKVGSIDIKARFDGIGLEEQILQAFKNTGARIE